MTLETWDRWQEHVEREGMRFAAAPVYEVFPTRDKPLKPYVAAVRASASTREVIAECDPEVVVADIITSAASLAAQAEGRAWATLVPHVMPTGEPGFPIYSIGAVYPRTALGRRFWSRVRPFVMTGEEQGRVELNGARERVGLPPLAFTHGGISRDLAIVATFPQLEYPRADPWPGMRVTGPLLWEQPFGDVELPPGDDPLVLVAPSTSQDPEHRLVRAALEGLAGERVRVLATHEPARAAVADRGAAERAARRLGLVRAHDAAVRRGGVPRRPRDRGARPGERRARGRVPRRGRHGGERGADQVGRSRRVAAEAVRDAARSAPRGAPPARPSPATGAAPPSCATGRPRTTAQPPPRTPSRSSRPANPRKMRVDVKEVLDARGRPLVYSSSRRGRSAKSEARGCEARPGI